MTETVAPLAGRKGLRLGWNVAPELPEECVADGLRLRQILLNLLNNAINLERELEPQMDRIYADFQNVMPISGLTCQGCIRIT